MQFKAIPQRIEIHSTVKTGSDKTISVTTRKRCINHSSQHTTAANDHHEKEAA